LKRIWRVVLAAAIPWIWIGSAQAQSLGAASEPEDAQRPAVMIPLTFAPNGPSLTRVNARARLLLWLPDQVELRKGSGLAVSRPVRMGTTDLQLSVAGPLLRKKNFGLAVEVRF